MSGSLEIIAMISLIIFFAYEVHGLLLLFSYPSYIYGPNYTDYTTLQAAINVSIATFSVYMIFSAIYLVFACLKIHGVRVENNKLIGTYLGFRYGLFAIHMIVFIILSIYGRSIIDAIIGLIVGGVHFILDIGLTIILHSIRVDREKTAGTENPMKKF